MAPLVMVRSAHPTATARENHLPGAAPIQVYFCGDPGEGHPLLVRIPADGDIDSARQRGFQQLKGVEAAGAAASFLGLIGKSFMLAV